jgi:hypothetical protein
MTAKRRKPRHLEDNLQRVTKRILDLIIGSDALYLHIPNGGKRDAREGARLKAQGVLAGAPDWLIITPDGRANFIELKVGANKQTAAQLEFQRRATAMSCQYHLATNLHEFQHALTLILRPQEPKT